MKLSEEELKDLEAFAGFIFSDKELAEILDVSETQLAAEMKKPDSKIRKTIVASRYKVEASLRKVQIDLALRGSTPAMAICNDYLKKIKR
jgi:hypothetical protein